MNLNEQIMQLLTQRARCLEMGKLFNNTNILL